MLPHVPVRIGRSNGSKGANLPFRVSTERKDHPWRWTRFDKREPVGGFCRADRFFGESNGFRKAGRFDVGCLHARRSVDHDDGDFTRKPYLAGLRTRQRGNREGNRHQLKKHQQVRPETLDKSVRPDFLRSLGPQKGCRNFHIATSHPQQVQHDDGGEKGERPEECGRILKAHAIQP